MKWNSLKTKAALASTALLSTLAQASPDLGAAEQQATNWHAIIMFAIFVGLTLFITKWAAKQTTSTQDFYTAGGGISGFQMAWRLQVTICQQHRSSVFPQWCLAQALMACFIH